MRKRLAVGGLTILGALAFGIVGTYAAFTSTGQELDTQAQSGTLDLQLSTDEGAEIEPIAFQNLVPGDVNSYFVRLTNTGTVSGKAYWMFSNVQELENTCVPPEVLAGDTDCGTGQQDGELGDQLAVTFSLMSGPGCTGTPQRVGPPSFPSSDSRVFRDLSGVVLAPNDTRCVRADVVFLDLAENNQAQSDSSSFGFRFQLST